MSDRHVPYDPTEIQRLRLHLALRNWELNTARRSHMEAECRFYQFAADASSTNLEFVQAFAPTQRADLDPAFQSR